MSFYSPRAHEVTCQAPDCEESFLSTDAVLAGFMADRWLCKAHDGSMPDYQPPIPRPGPDTPTQGGIAW